MKEKIIFDFLRDNEISYTLYKHQPLFTMNDRPILIDSGELTTIPGAYSKTLFLKDDKGSFYLLSVTGEKKVDLKALSQLLSSGRLSFGKAEELQELLSVTPGAVTPLGLIFDKENKVLYFLDEDLLKASFINVHPLRNDMTIGLNPNDLIKAMDKLNHHPTIITIPVKKV